MSDDDTCRPGDPNPEAERGDCSVRLRQPEALPYYCTRDSGHTGQHVAGSSEGVVVATWSGDGSDYQELLRE